MNFDQKVFMFPEEYNELRKELMLNWPELWKNWRCQWAMAFDAEIFVEFMNTKLNGVYRIAMATDDKQKEIGYICGTFLKELRRLRGEPNP